MTELKKDPLLSAARALIGLVIGLLAVVSAAMTILIVAALTFHHDYLVGELAAQGVPEQGLTIVILLVAMVIIVCGLGISFLLHLHRIVRSVGLGDPFNPVNADRLRTMGWITLLSQPVVWLIGMTARWFGQYTDKVDVNVGVSLSGFLLAIILFILARVFRTGAQMREDLEGTV